jgi:PHD/YefM family antitoxin component YafN of YafNO toxin-antitoxin module
MRISTGDLIRHFGKYSDDALNEPIIITRKGRDRLVLMSVDEYNFLCDAVSDGGVTSQADKTADRQTDEAPRTSSTTRTRGRVRR